MNKTFKVIWSKARNAYIVVSELAKNYCRASKTVAAAVMVSVLAGTMAASPAWGKVTEDTQKYTVVTGEIKTTKDDHNNPSGPLTYTTADMAIGSSSVAKGDKSTAIGNNSKVDGDYSIAIGNTSMVVNGSSSVAIGNHSTATGAATTVIGDHASGVRGATVIGKDSEATGIDSVAIGVLSNVHNGGGVAIGRNAVNDIDSGDGRSKPGVSIGDTSKAYGQSIAIGAVANALGSYSIAIGASANASGSYSIAFGEGANALGKYSIAFGEGAKVKNGATGSSIFGQWSTISADAINSVINGSWSSIGTNAFGSTAVGNGTKVEDNSSCATVIGYNAKTVAGGYYGTALGASSKVSVHEGVALGSYSIASTAEGEAGYDALTGENSTDESITWKATSAAVSVGGRVTMSNGYKDVTRQITNVAAGTQDTDAVNVAQLKRAMEKANKGWKLSTEGGAANQVASEATVDFSGKKDAGNHQNITVSNDGNNVKIDLASELHNVTGVVNGDSSVTLGMNTAGISNGTAQMTILGDSITLSKGVQGSVQIHGVAAGTADTDAVNVSQLKKVSDNSVNVDFTNISNNGKTEIVNIAKAADVHVKEGKYSVQADGNVTMTYVDGNGNEVTGNELKITDVASATQLNALNNTVTNIDGRVTTNSTNITTLKGEVITSGSIGANGKVELTKKDGSKVEVGTVKDYSVTSGTYDQTTKKLTLTKTDAYGNATSGTVDIDLGGIQSGDKNWTAQANGTDVKPNADNKVNFINGDNTNITTSSDGVIAVNLNNALTGIQSITGVGTGAGSISFADGAIKLNNKVTIDNTGKITGVAEGTIAAGSTDAVNGSQLYDVKNSINTDISNKTFGLEDDKGNKATSTLGNTVQVKGADGITSTVKDGALEIGLKLQDNSNLVVNSNGLALNTALTGIQSINGAGGTINLAGSAITINETTFNKDGRIQNVAAGTETKDAVNVGQLDATNKKVDNLTTEVGKGWVVATENGTATKVGAGDTVKFSGADNNIKVSNDGTNVKVELNKDLTVDSVKAGDFFMDKNEGVGYKGKAYITSSGLNANGQTITNVKAGEAETDAVNVGQLNAVKAEARKKTTLSNGKNTTVTSVTTDGQTDYKVNVAGDLKDITSVANGASEIKLNADSIIIANTNKTFAITNSGIGMSYVASDYSTKAIMLGENGTTISGGLNVAGSKITGVAAGTAATDAVNVGQLNAVKETANKGWKLKTNNGNVSDVKPGDEVEFDGDDNIKVSNAGNKVSFKLNNKLTGIESIAGVGGGSISFSGGNVTINNNVTFGSNGQIHNVTAGTASTDAVNVGQLNAAVQAGNTDTHIKPGEYGVGADNKVNMDVVDKTGTKINTVTITDVAKASDLGNVNNINNDLKNSNGTTTVVDAVNNLNQKLDNKVGDLQYSKVDKGDIADGDSTTTAIGKLDQKLNDVAATAAKQHTTVSGSGNIVVEDPTINADGGKNYNVKLADDINVNSVTANTFKADQTVMNKDGLKVGEKVSVTENAVTAGKTSISDDGVKVGDKTYISADGLNANDQKVTNVSDGKVEKDSKDAINGGQLHQAKADINNRIDGVENQVISNTNRINKLGSRVNKVGAGAAALAALHPMDFDPDDKLTFSAGYGNYAGENAAAIGAYYRPDEKVMFSVAGTVGNGENMVNAGVSFALDRTNHVSNSRTALAREVIDLRGQLAVMGAKMAKMEKAFGMLDETKTKLFPDVPANHWAYEYIAKLAGNGYIEGYPDGNFGGDRLMTRYEFAAMLYRAIENGAALEEKIIKEFEPELGRIRVDRISGEDGDRDKIERVRVNDTKGERDHYGNKLAK